MLLSWAWTCHVCRRCLNNCGYKTLTLRQSDIWCMENLPVSEPQKTTYCMYLYVYSIFFKCVCLYIYIYIYTIHVYIYTCIYTHARVSWYLQVQYSHSLLCWLLLKGPVLYSPPLGLQAIANLSAEKGVGLCWQAASQPRQQIPQLGHKMSRNFADRNIHTLRRHLKMISEIFGHWTLHIICGSNES